MNQNYFAVKNTERTKGKRIGRYRGVKGAAWWAVLAIWAGCAACALGQEAAAKAGAAKAGAAAAAEWTAWIEPNGAVHLERGGAPIASLIPGFFDENWNHTQLLPAEKEPPSAAEKGNDSHPGRIRTKSGVIIQTETKASGAPGELALAYTLTPQSDVRCNAMNVEMMLPAHLAIGGSFRVDGGERVAFPPQNDRLILKAGAVRSLELMLGGVKGAAAGTGATLRFTFAQPTQALVQDNRQWSEHFAIRFGKGGGKGEVWPAGKSLAVNFTLEAPGGGIAAKPDSPQVLVADSEWIPLADTELDIAPGSVLDFGGLIERVRPAGSLGRVVVTPGGEFAFASRPERPVRFYGVNLCYSAQYLSHEEAARLAERLERLGYNSVRFHHYEAGLIDRSGGASTRLDAQALDRLDFLFAELKKRGFVMTTDLFVSRPVFTREIWPDAESGEGAADGKGGDVPMEDFKIAVPVNERAHANYIEFARALLGHVNPYTQMRYADDPALAWICLINEDNPGNYPDRIRTGRLAKDWTRAWNAWLAKRLNPEELKALAASENAPTGVTGAPEIPIPPAGGDSPAATLFRVFQAETQAQFFEKTKAFLRNDLHCQALLTDMNGWAQQLESLPVRATYDYVDAHYYADHPDFLENPWQLPSRCANVNPLGLSDDGWLQTAPLRLSGRPFTLTEYDYAFPGRCRAMGPMLMGAQAALQGWQGVWRFTYAHSREAVLQPHPAEYFDLARDPLSQAADRAALCLFLRGDMRPASHDVIYAIDSASPPPANAQEVVGALARSRMPFLTRVATQIGIAPADAANSANVLTVALNSSDANKGASAGADLLSRISDGALAAEMRKRGWLKRDNPTNAGQRVYQSETGEITLDAQAGVLAVNTPRTVGGYAPAGGKIITSAATIEVEGCAAAVWISSLDGQPIARSSRLLVTHLTELANTGTTFSSHKRDVLLSWGRLPHLVRGGRAKITLRTEVLSKKGRAWSLATNGKRTAQVAGAQSAASPGVLEIPLDINNNGAARILYEVAE